jgi:hypothetical protein
MSCNQHQCVRQQTGWLGAASSRRCVFPSSTPHLCRVLQVVA